MLSSWINTTCFRLRQQGTEAIHIKRFFHASLLGKYLLSSNIRVGIVRFLTHWLLNFVVCVLGICFVIFNLYFYTQVGEISGKTYRPKVSPKTWMVLRRGVDNGLHVRIVPRVVKEWRREPFFDIIGEYTMQGRFVKPVGPNLRHITRVDGECSFHRYHRLPCIVKPNLERVTIIVLQQYRKIACVFVRADTQRRRFVLGRFLFFARLFLNLGIVDWVIIHAQVRRVILFQILNHLICNFLVDSCCHDSGNLIRQGLAGLKVSDDSVAISR
mmetsp:Transcript_9409/g.17977  ORF Transcript_9409/g.17977 Transcript_9409/m.17977 type:complete len:271 (-) Transcript_9409:510-1322(-)